MILSFAFEYCDVTNDKYDARSVVDVRPSTIY